MDNSLVREFHLACARGDLDKVKQLVGSNAITTKDLHGPYNSYVEYPEKALINACGSGNLDLVKYLFELSFADEFNIATPYIPNEYRCKPPYYHPLIEAFYSKNMMLVDYIMSKIFSNSCYNEKHFYESLSVIIIDILVKRGYTDAIIYLDSRGYVEKALNEYCFSDERLMDAFWYAMEKKKVDILDILVDTTKKDISEIFLKIKNYHWSEYFVQYYADKFKDISEEVMRKILGLHFKFYKVQGFFNLHKNSIISVSSNLIIDYVRGLSHSNSIEAFAWFYENGFIKKSDIDYDTADRISAVNEPLFNYILTNKLVDIKDKKIIKFVISKCSLKWIKRVFQVSKPNNKEKSFLYISYVCKNIFEDSIKFVINSTQISNKQAKIAINKANLYNNYVAFRCLARRYKICLTFGMLNNTCSHHIANYIINNLGSTEGNVDVATIMERSKLSINMMKLLYSLHRKYIIIDHKLIEDMLHHAQNYYKEASLGLISKILADHPLGNLSFTLKPTYRLVHKCHEYDMLYAFYFREYKKIRLSNKDLLSCYVNSILQNFWIVVPKEKIGWKRFFVNAIQFYAHLHSLK